MTGLLSPFGWCVLTIGGLSLLGLPIGLSMIGGSVLYLMISGQDVGIAAEQLLNGLSHTYTLLAIPLFILAAELMNRRLAERPPLVLPGARRPLSRRPRPGRRGVVVIFSGMSGSAIADAAGAGKLSMQMMTSKALPAGLRGGVPPPSATIGPIIPPSIPMVIYALVADTSVGYLFLAGVMPGLMMALAMMRSTAGRAPARVTRRAGGAARERGREHRARGPGADDAGDRALRHLGRGERRRPRPLPSPPPMRSSARPSLYRKLSCAGA